MIKELRKHKVLFAMMVPAVVYFFLLCYLPMAGTVLAFKNYRFDKGIFLSPWAGLDNFEFFFRSGKALLVTSNTVLYNAAFIVSGLLLQLAVAIVIAEMGGRFLRKAAQSVLLFPFFLSWVVVGAIVYNLLNYDYGFLNVLLRAVGLQPIDFYSSPGWWKYILLFFHNWKYVGYNSLVYLAAIIGIDRSLYEAASIDGANVFQRIRRITLPLIVPTTVIMVLLSVGNIFRGNFDLFYQLVGSNGLLFNATDVIDTFVFRSLLSSQDIGMSAATGLYQSVVCFAVILATNALVRRVQPDYSLF
ncbi:ABC transporter permease [Cohnella rhizosphaerae]|uniref:ABC transporter permease subunit n=1 Tax=Cohnella rhizosphaerae TaxID=1457232 RepID=A0A9X4KUS6_9BACL|nr:ABC transporter permease subunit [Cohnella rhizosphaerae]MDG0811277.1 ABC transporter permease subunit [Cohnella rhizosphaerae]